jgi:hypothetical protein
MIEAYGISLKLSYLSKQGLGTIDKRYRQLYADEDAIKLVKIEQAFENFLSSISFSAGL